MTESLPYQRDSYDHLDATGQFNAGEIRGRSSSIIGADVARQIVNPPKAEKPHYNADRRGGHGYPQPSDSSLDPNWNVGQKPLSGEQKGINAQGAALVRHIGEFSARSEFKKLSQSDKDAAIAREIADWRRRNN